MATPAPARSSHLQPLDWILAARTRLSRDGVDAVRVEVLCRDLRVSKGSFYWHFRDREELLEALLAGWENEEAAWLADDGGHARSAAARWARLVERQANPDRLSYDAAVRAWARQDPRVARRIVLIDKSRVEHIAAILSEVGFAPRAAGEWAETVMLVCLGWANRAARSDLPPGGRGLGELLSELILAASGRSANSSR